jgi:hypothetical protein
MNYQECILFILVSKDLRGPKRSWREVYKLYELRYLVSYRWKLLDEKVINLLRG